MFKSVIKTLSLAMIFTISAAPQGVAQTTEEVWQHHIQAWEERAVQDIAADYEDKSVLVLNNQVFKGREEIANVFGQLFKIFGAGANRIDPPLVLDRFVYITWHFTPTVRQEFFGSDTFVVENGKIVLQTIASPLYDVFPVVPLKK